MEQRKLLEAIALRDLVSRGMLSRTEIRDRVRAVWVEGNWSPSQLAAIIGYTPAGVRGMIKGRPGPARRPAGGTMHAAVLDLALAFTGAQEAAQRRLLIDECLKTGTSVRVLARILDYPATNIARRKRLLTTKGTSR